MHTSGGFAASRFTISYVHPAALVAQPGAGPQGPEAQRPSPSPAPRPRPKTPKPQADKVAKVSGPKSPLQKLLDVATLECSEKQRQKIPPDYFHSTHSRSTACS